MVELKVKKNDDGQSIISFLKKMISYKKERVNLYKLIRTKKIKVNNQLVKDTSFVIFENDIITIYYDVKIMEKHDRLMYTNAKIQVVYEDENLLVVIKDHNILVHNAYGDSLDNMVQNYLVDKNEYNFSNEQTFVISHVHRIDKLTKGLVMYGKNRKIQQYLLNKISQNEFIEKVYLLECEGLVSFTDLELSGFLEHSEPLKKMIFSTEPHEDAKSSITIFKLIEKREKTSILEARLVTGRKNQIRASLEYLKHPIVNDYKYGARKINHEKMIYLYAYKLQFNNFSDDFKYLNGKTIVMDVQL